MAKIEPDEPCPCGSGNLFRECHGPRVIANKPPKISQKVTLKVIPEPDPLTRSIIVFNGEGTVVFQGNGTEIAQCCGKCGSSLIVGLNAGQIQGIVFKCNACGAFNDT